jgi:uncharacterized UPF0146 family protein
VVLVAVVVVEATVERVAVRVVEVGVAFCVDVGWGVLVDGVDCAVVECLADPQAATPSASTTAAVVR